MGEANLKARYKGWQGNDADHIVNGKVSLTLDQLVSPRICPLRSYTGQPCCPTSPSGSGEGTPRGRRGLALNDGPGQQVGVAEEEPEKKGAAAA